MGFSSSGSALDASLSRGGLGEIRHRPSNVFGASLSVYQNQSDAQPRARIAADRITFGAGGAADTDTFLLRDSGGGLVMGAAVLGGYGFKLDANSSDVAMDALGSGGLQTRMQIVGKPANGTNGDRAEDITDDSANGTGHTSYDMLDLRSAGQWANDTKGSFHHFVSIMENAPYAGGGDIYNEDFNCFMGHTVNRRGALTGAWESDMECNEVARSAGLRSIMREGHSLATYASVLGLSSVWARTGNRAFEAIALKNTATAELRSGTGVLIHGHAGWEWALQVWDIAGNYVSGFDGNGGVVTKSKAGAPVDADFRHPAPGMIAVDSTNSRIYVRIGSTWKYATLT